MVVAQISSGKSFAVAEGESLLDCALQSGITLPYSCQTGRCGSCKARVVRGNTTALCDELALSDVERGDGWILTCVRTATTDVTLDIDELVDAHLFPAKTAPCRIQDLARLAEDVLRVTLRLPPGFDFHYRSGQFVDIIGHGGLRRSYSIANAPSVDNRLELHIKRVPGGAFSRYWFEAAKVNDLLRLHGPSGTFFLRESDGVELIFLATGTGIAPIKAILEDMSNKGVPELEKATIFWGGRSSSDLYWDPSNDGLSCRIIPVLSRARANWNGHRGYVQQAAVGSPRDWSRTAVYACGSETMIHDARRLLGAAGLSERRFLSDAFVCSGPATDAQGPHPLSR